MTKFINATKLGRPEDYPERVILEDEQLPWNVSVPDYEPEYYVSDHVLQKAAEGLADKEKMVYTAKTVRSVVEVRRDPIGRPLNPMGRTGIAGRGKLYQWGANHAADMILTRGNPQNLELVLGIRKDNGKLALPGGFLNIGELAIQAALRELWEETHIELRTSQPRPAFLAVDQRLVHNSERMTDHAWIETSIYHIDAKQAGVDRAVPVAGDDLKWAGWVALRGLDLDALHDEHGNYIRHCLGLYGLDASQLQ